jgi:hypothetical protein
MNVKDKKCLTPADWATAGGHTECAAFLKEVSVGKAGNERASKGSASKSSSGKGSSSNTDSITKTSAQPSLSPGCQIRLKGLTSEAGQLLNGTVGVVDGFVADKGRWSVSMEGGAKKTFKMENLELAEEVYSLSD